VADRSRSSATRSILQAGLKLARDVAAYDLEQRRSPKQLNPVLFGLGRPGCGKTITAHAIGNYFLEYCRERDIPARFKVIRRTDWASSYQNASAATLVKIFKEEVYGFDGVCGVYWPDIDTAFASRSSGDLRSEEKNNLGAVFGIFDGTLIPKDGKWFMICDANFMQMDEATRSRIAQNPFTVKGPTTSEDYVQLLREMLLGERAPVRQRSARRRAGGGRRGAGGGGPERALGGEHRRQHPRDDPGLRVPARVLQGELSTSASGSSIACRSGSDRRRAQGGSRTTCSSTATRRSARPASASTAR
jgi:hypothetical protein